MGHGIHQLIGYGVVPADIEDVPLILTAQELHSIRIWILLVMEACLLLSMTGIRRIFYKALGKRIATLQRSGMSRFVDSCCPWGRPTLRSDPHPGRNTLNDYGFMDIMCIGSMKGFLIVSYHCHYELIYGLLILIVHSLKVEPRIKAIASTMIGICRISTVHIPELADWIFELSDLHTCVSLPTLFRFVRGYIEYYKTKNPENRPRFCPQTSYVYTASFVMWNIIQVLIEFQLQWYMIRLSEYNKYLEFEKIRSCSLYLFFPKLCIVYMTYLVMMVTPDEMSYRRKRMSIWNRVPSIFTSSIGCQAEMFIRSLQICCLILSMKETNTLIVSFAFVPSVTGLTSLLKLEGYLQICLLYQMIFSLYWSCCSGGSWLGVDINQRSTSKLISHPHSIQEIRLLSMGIAKYCPPSHMKSYKPSHIDGTDEILDMLHGWNGPRVITS